MIRATREAAAMYLGAPSGETISFGANMTTLCFSLSRAIGRVLRPGDEILITQLDHEANRGPWLSLREQGIVVREIGLRPDATLDYDNFRAKVNERTKLVALGWASNAFGTVNDVAFAREITYAVGAWLLVDAVHYAPHFTIDVRSTGVDFLLCSAYKFYGPHVGILYAREGLLDQLPTDRLRTQDPRSPHRIETGTLNHAALAGVLAAVEYVASYGVGADLRSRLVDAMRIIGEHERTLGAQLYDGLRGIPGVTVHGTPFASALRAPTLACSIGHQHPDAVAAQLAREGIAAWNGHFYAIRPMEVLGLHERGGVVRLGVSLYTSSEDITRVLTAIRHIAQENE
jgi:cysteine desulfurase family protein (TIGR01976 family)